MEGGIKALKFFLNKSLFGAKYTLEYLCVARDELKDILKVFLTGKEDSYFRSVETKLLFLGYNPLIMSIASDTNSADEKWLINQNKVCLTYCNGDFQIDTIWKNLKSQRKSVARLSMRPIFIKRLSGITQMFFIGEYGMHRLVPNVNRLATNLKFFLRKRHSSNYLNGNLYEQVRIAYSLPITISIITVGDNKNMNLFPTDLHGQVGKDYYVSSLRIGSKSSQQVEYFKKLVITEVEASSAKQAYDLGKNHMQELQPHDNFDILGQSKYYNLPLPNSALFYHELRVISFYDYGIHRIYFYKIEHQMMIREGSSLCHIHSFYAHWRERHGQPINIAPR